MIESLLVDEHFPAQVAVLLRADGFDVVAVAESPDLIGAPDEVIFAAAISQGRRVLTENVRDFRPLLATALAAGEPYAPLLLTTAQRHPRTIGAIGRLVGDLRAWLQATGRPHQPEEWL